MPSRELWHEGTWHDEALPQVTQQEHRGKQEGDMRGPASKPRTRASACSHRSSMSISNSGGGARSSDTTGFFWAVAERLDRKPMPMDVHVDPAVRCATLTVQSPPLRKWS